jgi:membrane protein DedA with SNARE-associated domain
VNLTSDTLIHLLQNWGLLLLFPLAVVEGPIVTVVAGWIVRLGLFPFGWAFATCVAADLAGDMILYGLGRGGARIMPPKWRSRLGVDDARLASLARHFDKRGGRTLVLTKLSHSLGFAVLPAAGAAQMPVGSFVFWNLLGTLPKSLALLLLGYFLGQAHDSIGTWIGRGTATILIVAICAVVVIWVRRRRRLA